MRQGRYPKVDAWMLRPDDVPDVRPDPNDVEAWRKFCASQKCAEWRRGVGIIHWRPGFAPTVVIKEHEGR